MPKSVICRILGILTMLRFIKFGVNVKNKVETNNIYIEDEWKLSRISAYVIPEDNVISVCLALLQFGKLINRRD